MTTVRQFLAPTYPTHELARQAMFKYFDAHRRFSVSDMDLVCVDVSPVILWMEEATEAELVKFSRNTPVKLGFPRALLGFTMPAGERGERHGVAIVQCMRTHEGLIGVRSVLPGGTVDNGFAIEIDKAGRGVGTRQMENYPFTPTPFAGIISAALAMFNVRNIGLRPIPMPRTLRRQAMRDGLRGPQVYHTLILHPFAAVAAEPGRPRMQTGDMPLHLVRGHFAHYTEARKLFGKYAGTFWVPEHEAGNASIAVVRKTYVINPNEEVS
jgi:hypothetical protein